MYVVIRRFTNVDVLGDAMQQREQEVRDLISGVPGFVAYYATRNDDTLTTITVCNDQAGTQESTRLAGEWARKQMAGAVMAPPEITEGETFLQFQGHQ